MTLVGLTHRYRDGVTVLDGIDLTAASGQVVALMGPSGSGKSTLLAIAGLVTRPTAGQVCYDDRPVTVRDGPMQLGTKVAWLFQDNNVLGARTARDNVALGLTGSGVRWRQALDQADEALGLVGLGGHVSEKVSTLSGGEAQRVGVARVLVQRPRLLLCDEPTAQLDRSNSQMVFEALEAVGDASTTVLVASHDPQVASIADRVIDLRDGRLEERR